MIILIVFVLGIALGVIISALVIEKSVSGDLIVTHDEDGYYLSLKLNEVVDNVRKRKIIYFKINDISQK